MRTLLAGLLLPLLFVPAPAQETTVVPAAAMPLLRIDTVGPAGWRKMFVPTNLGSLLASGEGESLWRPLVSRLEGMLEAVAGKEDYRAARGRLLDYGGEVHAQLWLSPPAEGREPQVVYAVWADPDARTDLGALASELTRGIGRLMGESKAEKAGAGEVMLWRTSDGWLTTPAVVEGKLRFVASNMRDVEAGLRIAANAPMPAPARSSALSVRVEMAAWQREIKRAGVEENAILELLGLNALDSLAFALGTAGPRVEFEMSAAFNGGQRGLIGALVPEHAGLPALRHLVPPKCEQWHVTRFDAKSFYLACENLAASFGAGDTKKVRDQVKEYLGFDPIADLLDHATDEVLLLGDVPLPSGSDAERGVDFAIAVRLKDGKAFRKNWDVLLGKEDSLFSVQERYEHDGIPVLRYGSMFLPGFHTAVSDRLLVLAFGPEAKDRLGFLLDADKAPGAAEKQPPLPPLLQEVSRRAPEGSNGMSLIDLDTLLGRQVLTILDEAERSILRGVGDIGLDTESVRTAIDQMLPLLRQYNLHRACTVSGWAKGRWLFRAYW